MTYAFTFDASACSGCKACQVACKDKNNLPTGVLWRRVYEVSGGSWQQQGEAWTTDVFAYNLSMACNHCVHPKCAGVCPTDAYVVRTDGIVYIDETKCMGCGYCSWACPYSAPRYNPEARHMTKCNFCFDNLDAGLPPACVAACPMRVLNCVSLTPSPLPLGEGQGVRALWDIPGAEHPFPLPVFSRTQPHLELKPHAGMVNGLEKTISNWEEIQTQRTQRTQRKTFVPFESFKFNGFEELPLVIFTLCAQMAAGMAVFALFGGPLSFLMLAILAGLIGVGGLASFLHLGKPLNAWRALNHLNKSWLSREILMYGLFGASWLTCVILPGMGKLPLALTGLGLVYSMAQVYRFKAAAIWNTWRTPMAFFLSTGVLGLTGVALGAGQTWVWFPLWVLLAAEAWLAFSGRKQSHITVAWMRVVCLELVMVGIGLLPLVTEPARMWLSFSIFLLIFIQEILGRWLYYEMRQPGL